LNNNSYEVAIESAVQLLAVILPYKSYARFVTDCVCPHSRLTPCVIEVYFSRPPRAWVFLFIFLVTDTENHKYLVRFSVLLIQLLYDSLMTDEVMQRRIRYCRMTVKGEEGRYSGIF